MDCATRAFQQAYPSMAARSQCFDRLVEVAEIPHRAPGYAYDRQFFAFDLASGAVADSTGRVSVSEIAAPRALATQP